MSSALQYLERIYSHSLNIWNYTKEHCFARDICHKKGKGKAIPVTGRESP
jgi:hypothetical protein